MELLAAACLGVGLGTLVLACWPRAPLCAPRPLPRLELDDGTPRTLH